MPLSENICGKEHKFEVYEFNRLCIDLPIEERKNVATWFCSRTIKLLPNGLILVSYADTKQGHVGYVYQALNCLYTGLGSANTEYILKDGTKKHSRWRKSYFGEIESKIRQKPKHRYVYFTGTRKQKKEFLSLLKWPILPYPKGNSKRYDDTAKVKKPSIGFGLINYKKRGKYQERYADSNQ